MFSLKQFQNCFGLMLYETRHVTSLHHATFNVNKRKSLHKAVFSIKSLLKKSARSSFMLERQSGCLSRACSYRTKIMHFYEPRFVCVWVSITHALLCNAAPYHEGASLNARLFKKQVLALLPMRKPLFLL